MLRTESRVGSPDRMQSIPYGLSGLPERTSTPTSATEDRALYTPMVKPMKPRLSGSTERLSTAHYSVASTPLIQEYGNRNVRLGGSLVEPLETATFQPLSTVYTLGWLLFKYFVLPTLAIPALLWIVPLQSPHDSKGYEDNWSWVGIFVPLISMQLAVFPTYIISTIMGTPPSSSKNFAWRIFSIAFAGGLGGVVSYALAAIAIYPSLSPAKAFPIPWTPVWLAPFVILASAFLARYIR
jgi:hypothetical protein